MSKPAKDRSPAARRAALGRAPLAEVLYGDCREQLRQLPDACVDACATDPPYELGFMGKGWDRSGVANDVALWREVLRVLKPGGYLLAFGGTRTYHRMACAIEDAGFEVRDSLHWWYLNGFPKSLDVSKAIDKATVRTLYGDLKFRGHMEEVLAVTRAIRALRDAANLCNADLDAPFGFVGMSGHWTSKTSQPEVPTWEQWQVLRAMLLPAAEPSWLDAEVWRLDGRKGKPGEAWHEREVVGTERMRDASRDRVGVPDYDGNTGASREVDITVAHTPEAEQWDGWGTALKPAHEPIVLARKPMPGTVAAQVLSTGTGALDVASCRIGESGGGTTCPHFPGPCLGHESKTALRKTYHTRSGEVVHAPQSDPANRLGVDQVAPGADGSAERMRQAQEESTRRMAEMGRWPANVLVSEEFAAEYEREHGLDLRTYFYCPKPTRRERDLGCEHLPPRTGGQATEREDGSDGLSSPRAGAGRTGGARNFHPTCKPINLMRYLVRLVARPGAVVLDPFAGSGTTGMAAVLESCDFLGCELTEEYRPILEGRLAWALRAAASGEED